MLDGHDVEMSEEQLQAGCEVRYALERKILAMPCENPRDMSLRPGGPLSSQPVALSHLSDVGCMNGDGIHRSEIHNKKMICEVEWWATLESNQAWVSPAELQSAAAPCSTSPAERFGVGGDYRQAAGASSGEKGKKRGPDKNASAPPRNLQFPPISAQPNGRSEDAMAEKPQKTKKPTWVIDKERARRAAAAETVWLFGLHAVRDALANPAREKLRLVVTQNALDRLGPLPEGILPEVTDARSFDRIVPLPPESVHQGAALEVKALKWGSLADLALSGPGRPLLVALDRVTDPHNVGAILRSAEVFGARAVIAPSRHSAPETGALAKTASGALERQPYLRVGNLADALIELKEMGYIVLGLDGTGEEELPDALAALPGRAICLVLGAEGPGLRERTRETCDKILRIPFAADFGSLNVSNAAAVALYAASRIRASESQPG